MKNNNIWAPWRIEYLKSFTDAEADVTQSGPGKDKCFLCQYWTQPDKDRENLVLWRTELCLVTLNRFPYTGGHLLIAPHEHVPGIDALDDNTILQMMLLTRDAQKVLDHAIHPHGYNIGINLGRCAGAGLPGHLHLHLVPRWDGDTNFMNVTGNARVISQALDELHEQLTKISKQMNLPNIS